MTRRLVAAAAFVVAFVATAPAFPAVNLSSTSWTLSTKQQYKTAGKPLVKTTGAGTFTVDSTGAAFNLSDGYPITGTLAAQGKHGFKLTLDQGSNAADGDPDDMADRVENQFGLVGVTTITVTSFKHKATGKIDKTGTKMTINISATLRGYYLVGTKKHAISSKFTFVDTGTKN